MPGDSGRTARGGVWYGMRDWIESGQGGYKKK